MTRPRIEFMLSMLPGILPGMFPTPRQQAEFFGQLGTTLEAGLPLSRALPLVSHDRLGIQKAYWLQVAVQLDQGMDFETALTRTGLRPPLSPWYLTLLGTAEHCGALSVLCQHLAQRSWADVRRDRYRQSVIQSLGFFVAGTIVGLGWLLGLSGIWILGLLVLSIGAIVLVLRFPQFESFRQRMPIVAPYDQIQFVLRLTELALPLQCGLSILASLDLLQRHLPSGLLKQTLNQAALKVTQGHPLSEAFGRGIPPLLRQYVQTGETSGSLETMLMKVAEYYDQELETLLRKTQGILQPLSILGLGAIVLVLGIGLLQQLTAQFPL